MRLNKLNHLSLEQRNIYCEDEARRTDKLCSKDLNFPLVFREEFLKAKFGAGATGYVTCFCLVGGEVMDSVPGMLCSAKS